MPYQVGQPTNPKPDDPWFDKMTEAVELAKRWADRDENTPIAVWDSECNPLALFLCGDRWQLA